MLQAGINVFVEKPLSVKPVEEVERLAQELKKVQESNGVTIAVGYMLRYSPAVEASILNVNRRFLHLPYIVHRCFGGTSVT